VLGLGPSTVFLQRKCYILKPAAILLTFHAKTKTIITNCAACAAPLAHDAPRCVRCKTRYCNSTCQHDHWRRGHKQICKKIHCGGNAEQYHADK